MTARSVPPPAHSSSADGTRKEVPPVPRRVFPYRDVFSRVRGVLRPLWQLAPPLTIAVGASPDSCFATLATAARPNQNRLHLRAVFTEGRRYSVQKTGDGFRVMSNTRPLWGNRRQRTRVSAVVFGILDPFDARRRGSRAREGAGEQVDEAGERPLTFVRVRARISIVYAASAFLLPIFFSTMVYYTPWPTPLRAGLIAALFLSSWIGHRMDAAYQANAVLFFIQKALEDLPRAEIARLPEAEPRADVVLNDAFREAWERFYRAAGEGGEVEGRKGDAGDGGQADGTAPPPPPPSPSGNGT